MTIGTRLHQCLASAETVSADLKSFALETENKQAKAEYAQLAQDMEKTVERLRSQVNRVEQEEPQYKVYQQAVQKASKSQTKS